MEYLEADFDPMNAKVPELRKFLTENNVEYPSKAKKSTLVKLFNETVKPKVPGLRNKNKNVSPSSEGIEKVKSRSRSKSPKKKRTREEAKAFLSIDVVDVDGDIKMEVSGAKVSRDLDNDEDLSKRKRRKREQAEKKKKHKSPTKKTNESPSKSLAIDKFEGESSSSESLNTSFQQFQPKTEEKENKSNIIDTKNKKKRRHQAPDIEKLNVSKDFKIKLEESMGSQEPEDVPVKIKDEVILQEVEPIVKDETEVVKGKTERCQKSKKCLKVTLHVAIQLIYFSVIASAVLFSVWMREQKIQVGYCGHELPLIPLSSHSVENVAFDKLDAILEHAKPACLPCPEHAICSTKMQVRCKPGFVVSSSPFTLNGLLPLSDSCIEDDTKVRALSKSIDIIMKTLREHNAKLECGRCTDDISAGISEKELRKIVSHGLEESFALSNAQFKQVWAQAVKKVRYFPEIRFNMLREKIHNAEAEAIKLGHFRSISQKAMSWKCVYETQLRVLYFENQVIILSVATVLLIALLTKRAFNNRNEQMRVIHSYTEKAAERLQRAIREKQEPSFLHTLQLKEDILGDVEDIHQKQFLWDQLTRKLEQDSDNVSSSQIEINGEILKCWKWIGDLDE